MAAPQPDPETKDALEQRRQSECARRWIAELTASEKAQRSYLERARKIVRRYKAERSEGDKVRRFAMLWTNVQTIQPAVFARPPQPLVSRRFKDADPVGKAASEVLERGLSYSVDKQDLDGVLRTTCLDYVLIARAQTWERYVPTHGPAVVPPPIKLQVTTGPDGGISYSDEDGNPYTDDQVTGDAETGYTHQPASFEPVVWEESVTDYVNWEDFGTSVARTWDEVTYVWRRVYLSREQLKKRFGENLGKMIPLDWGPVKQGKHEDPVGNKAAVYEIWDKSTKRVFWISKSWSSRPLDERPDPLGLDSFFPCPRPLLGTVMSDSLIPVPDYVFYQDQAEEIDTLTARIAVLEKALKVRGFYAGDIKTNLNNLLNSDTNTLIPVPEWQTLKDGGGVQGKIEWFPVAQVIETLNACISARKQLIDDVYQITGVADIMRGASDPRATATAEGLKANWGSLRVRDRQKEMARFARDVIRIKAEVIAEKFSADTLKAMTSVKLPTNAEKAQAQAQVDQIIATAQQAAQQAQMAAQQPPQPGQAVMGGNGGPPMPPEPEIPDEIAEVLRSPSWEDVEALLQDNAMRQFRVDIETDSTIEPDESEEKAQTVELLTAISSMVQQWGPALAAQPAIAPMVGELIKFALRRFRAGRTLEDVIDSTVDKLVAQAAQAPPPGAAPPIDKTPVEVAQLDLAAEQTKQQGETQRAQMDAQIEVGRQAIDQQTNQLKLVAIARDPNPQGAA